MANWKGTAVPNSGVYQTIYINTALTIEEVVNILEKLNFISFSDFGTYPVMSVDYSSTGGNEGVNYSELTVFRTEGQLMIMAGYNPIFDSTVGWYDGIETSLINTREGITFMNATDSDEGLIPVGAENDKLSSLFSITPFTQNEPITNLPEFLTGIADAIRKKKGTTEPINAQDFSSEIESIEGGGGCGGKIESLNFVENGTYDKLYAVEQVTINRSNFDFDFELQSLKFKKLPMFSVMEKVSLIPLNEQYKISIEGVASGQIVKNAIPMMYFYDVGEGFSYLMGDIDFPFLMWIQDPAMLNEMLQTDKFEANSVYVSDLVFTVAEEIARVSFDELSITIFAPGKTLLDGVMPVNIMVEPNLQSSFYIDENTENGIYTPEEGYNGFEEIEVNIQNNDLNEHIATGLAESTYVEEENKYKFVAKSGSAYRGEIREYAFAGTKYDIIDLSNIDNVQYFNKYCFADCKASTIQLQPVNFGYTYIREKAFLNAVNIVDLTFDNTSVMGICGDAFNGCSSLEKVVFNSVRIDNSDETYSNNIGENGNYYELYNTFAGCSNLKEVVFKSMKHTFKQYNAFEDCPNVLIYVPDTLVDSLKVESSWANIADKIRPLSEYGNKPKPYLTFSSPNTFTLKNGNNTKYWNGTLEYSTDASAWSEWNGTSVSSSTDGKLYIRGTGNTYITGSTGFDSQIKWVLTGNDISCSGNIETLLDCQTVANGEHPIMANSCYRDMFSGCTSLINAPELPATTLTGSCYLRMFNGCKGLTTPPKLPATILATDCYRDMFNGCTNLTTAPELPATILQNYCYRDMFNGCKGLTTPPKLPATALALGCYYNMFRGCISLISIPKLPATTLKDYCYYTMFSGCTNIKISATQTGDYQIEYRIPTSGTGATAKKPFDTMFYGTGGTFTGTPTINTTYYTSNAVV